MTPEERADAIIVRLVKATGAAQMKTILSQAFGAVERDTVSDIVGTAGTERTNKLLDTAEDAFRITHWLVRCSRSFPRQLLFEYRKVLVAKTKEYETVLKEFSPERLEAFAKEE